MFHSLSEEDLQGTPVDVNRFCPPVGQSNLRSMSQPDLRDTVKPDVIVTRDFLTTLSFLLGAQIMGLLLGLWITVMVIL